MSTLIISLSAAQLFQIQSNHLIYAAQAFKSLHITNLGDDHYRFHVTESAETALYLFGLVGSCAPDQCRSAYEQVTNRSLHPRNNQAFAPDNVPATSSRPEQTLVPPVPPTVPPSDVPAVPPASSSEQQEHRPDAPISLSSTDEMPPKQDYPIVDTGKWLSKWRGREPIRSFKFAIWTPADGNGQKPQRTGQGIATDPICSEWKALVNTEDPYKDSLEYDPPVFVKLSDWLVYLLVHLTHQNERAAHWQVDFNVDGNIRAQRVPLGDPVIIQAHGLNWFAVYNGAYVLLGGELAKTRNWIINVQRVPWKQYQSFGIGLVLAPGQSPIPLFNVSMHYHDRPAATESTTGYQAAFQQAGASDVWFPNHTDRPVLDILRRRIVYLRDLPFDNKACADVPDTDVLQPKRKHNNPPATPLKKGKKQSSERHESSTEHSDPEHSDVDVSSPRVSRRLQDKKRKRKGHKRSKTKSKSRVSSEDDQTSSESSEPVRKQKRKDRRKDRRREKRSITVSSVDSDHSDGSEVSPDETPTPSSRKSKNKQKPATKPTSEQRQPDQQAREHVEAPATPLKQTTPLKIQSGPTSDRVQKYKESLQRSKQPMSFPARPEISNQFKEQLKSLTDSLAQQKTALDNFTDRFTAMDIRLSVVERRASDLQAELDVLPALRDSLPKSAKDDIDLINQDLALVHTDLEDIRDKTGFPYPEENKPADHANG
jgi:hypothetical protein